MADNWNNQYNTGGQPAKSPSINDYLMGGGKSLLDTAGNMTGATASWGWGGLSGDDKRAKEANKVFNPKTGNWEQPNIYNPFKANTWGYYGDYVRNALPNALLPAAAVYAMGKFSPSIGAGLKGGTAAYGESLAAGMTPGFSLAPALTSGIKMGLTDFAKSGWKNQILTGAGSVFGLLNTLKEANANANEKYKPKTTTPSAPVNPYAAANAVDKNIGIGSDTFWETYKKANPKGAAEMTTEWDKAKGLGSPNSDFWKEWDKANRTQAEARRISNITLDPETEALFSQQKRSVDEHYNDLLNQIDTQNENITKGAANQAGQINRGTTGRNLDTRAALASLNMLASPGQYNTAVNANIAQGTGAVTKVNAEAAAAKAANKQKASEAGTLRQEDMDKIALAKTIALNALKKKNSLGQGE